MIDEVSHEMGDSYERWRNEADLRTRRSRERRAREKAERDREADRQLLPRTWPEWGAVLVIVLGLFVFFALLGAAAGVDLPKK